MTKQLKKWETIGFIFVSLFGSLGHFLYDLSGQNSLVGKFFAVNESTWEHLKLLFFPYVIFMVLEWFVIGKNYKGFVFSKFIGVVLGLLSIVVLFYTYTGILGRSIDVLNIIIFVIGTFISFYVSYRLLSGGTKVALNGPALIGFLVIAVLFVLFTANPPRINLFRDPVTNTYGAQRMIK